MNATSYNIESIIAATAGRSLHTHDSWNGSSMTIIVESAEQMSMSVYFTGTNAWGEKYGIYVNNECVESLLSNGRAIHRENIERCNSQTIWTLK